MSKIEWSPRLSVRNAKMDEQHKELIDMINDLQPSRQPQDPDETLGKMERYLRYHFREEEALLRIARYPDLWAHKKQHIKFIRAFLAMRSRAKAGDTLVLSDLRRFLIEWLRQHIMNSDKRYGVFFASKWVDPS